VIVPALAFIAGDKFWWPSRSASPSLFGRGEKSARGAVAPDPQGKA
jgi:hypothetical protein